MNSKLFIYLIIAVAVVGCKDNFVRISGTITSPSSGTYIYLDELKSDELRSVDSVKVSDDGRFSFKKEVNNPSFYLLKSSENNFLTLLVEPGEEITLEVHNDSLSSPVSLSGSPGSELLVEYNRELRRTINKLTGLNKIYMENSEKPELVKVVSSLDSLAQIYLSEINTYTKKYIDDNITSLVSLVALYQQVAPSVYVLNPARDMKYFLKVDSSMYSLYPEYEPVVTLHGQVKELASKMEEQPPAETSAVSENKAPEIALPTPAGDTIRLSSTRGSVVLLDFWASWCAPCRKENPNLVNAYNLYHKKGFQIYQVSLDKTKEAWMRGIEDDQLGKWIHVSDVQYWNSSVVPLYKIESIPSNYLLDKEGNIIASNLRGERLNEVLAELYK
jgi:thiol-disulfide isomerase/thioredoxin